MTTITTSPPSAYSVGIAPMPGVLERPVPYNVEAEKAVIGSLLIDRDAVIKIAAFLKPADFYNEAHGVIYEAMLELFARSEPGDFITLVNELTRNNRLVFVGGLAYLADLPSAVPTAVHVEYYARIVVEMATYRRLIRAGGLIASLGYQTNEGTSKVMAAAEQMLSSVAQQHVQQDFVPLATTLEEMFDTLPVEPQPDTMGGGVPTGFVDIDELTGGLQPSDLIVVACRPSVGKTSMLLSITHNTAFRLGRQRVGIFSMEMSREQIALRLLAMETGIDTHSIRRGLLSDQQRTDLVRAFGDLSTAPIYIDDTPSLTVSDIRAKAKRLQATVGVDIIIVDYLQLMQGRSKDGNRVQEVSEMSRGLKLLARELNVPVVAAAQLSRGVESRQSHVPMLSDLRESGGIENDADIVMFIHRPEMYDPDSADLQGIAEIHIAKHRNGPTGMVRMLFQKQTTRFVDLDRGY